MADHAEPMEVDCMDSDFDNKENTFHHGNVPCTEKGYEELDVSELNMKLRFSITPASSPMSKSYTACPDNRYPETDSALNYSNTTCNLTRSLNSSMTKNDSVIKSLKSLPLQSLHTEQPPELNGNPAVLRQLDSTFTDDINITVTITGANEIDENVSLPSLSSSALHTPEATTPTKDIKDGGSPIMRGLKSVLNMFRSSQSPVPPSEDDISAIKHETPIVDTSMNENVKHHVVASTPISTHRAKDGNSSKRSSPYKDSIVFNDDLEKELNWKNDTTINSSTDKIPIHKMLLQNNKSTILTAGLDLNKSNAENNLNATAEYMDVSNNDTVIEDKTVTENHVHKDVSTGPESDSEFVDCETTFSKNQSYVLDIKSVQQRLAVNDTFCKNESYVLDVQAVREVLSPSLPEEIVPANIPVENPQINIKPDITNVSFADLEFKDDGDLTLPTDYSDYSKCTSEILSEIEKVEANISSEAEVNDKAIQNKHVTVQAGPHEVASTDLLHSNNTKSIQTVETRNKIKEEIVETNVTITPTQEVDFDSMSKVEAVPENDVRTEVNNTHVEMEQKEEAEVQAICTEDNSKGECDPFHDLSDKNDLNSTVMLVASNTENSSEHTKCSISSNIETPIDINVNETTLSDILIEVQNNSKSDDISSVRNNVPSENVNNSQYKDVFSVDLCVAQSDGSLKPFDILPSSEINSVDISNIVESLVVEKPSDLPLPDDDEDLDKEIGPIEGPAIPVETTPITTEIRMAVTPSDSQAIETVSEIHITENEPSTDLLLNSKIIISQPFQNQGLSNDINTQCDVNLPNNVTTNVEQVCNLSLDEDCSMVLKTPAITTNLTTTSAIVNNEDKGERDDVTQLDSKVDNKNISEEVIVSHDGTMNIICSNANSTVVCSQELVSKMNVTVTKLSPEPVQNCVQDEPMDISMNETLTKTHGLPDLVNQTFDMTGEHLNGNEQITIQDPTTNASSIVESKDNIDVPKIEPHMSESETTPDSSNNISKNGVNNCATLENNILTGLVEQNLKNVNESENIEIKEFTAVFQDDKLNEKDELPPKILTNSPMSDPMDDKAKNNYKEVTNSVINCIKFEDNILTSLSIEQDLKKNYKLEDIKHLEVAAVCQKDDKLSESEELPPKIFTNSPFSEPIDYKTITVDEEVVVSATNSPYVSLMSGIEPVLEKTEETFEEIENAFTTKTSIASSPPIVSKGYNFNFDEIEDPFVTNTKIRLSPPLDSPDKTIRTDEMRDKQFNVSSVSNNKRADMNRRKSQPAEKKKPTPLKKKFNASFDAKKTPTKPFPKLEDIHSCTVEDSKNKTVEVIISEVPESEKSVAENFTNEIIKTLNDKKFEKYLTENDIQKASSNTAIVSYNLTQTCEECKPMIDSALAISNEIKVPSSSEQSIYYSAGTSSTESIKTSKNVFNLPEIDDMNFNPFATKSKMRSSPPPVETEMDNPFATKSKIRQSPPPSTNVENPFVSKSKIPQSPPPNTDMDDQFATKTKIKSSSGKLANRTSKFELNRTATFDESKLTQLVKGTESDDKIETELMEKDTSANTTGTISSKASDHLNITTHEVNTEDEDTIEGPFLDVDDEIEKMGDFEINNDIMNFDEIKEAPPCNEDNLDGEIFIDAEAFEFLLNQNKSNVVADSGKESLFLKFDPLFAKRISSGGVVSSLNAQKKQSTPTKPARPSLRIEASPIAGPSTLNATYDGETNISQESIEDANITVTKPMMAVPPALNPAVTPRNKSITPTRSNRRSITFTSPAIAVIDRLLSMSSNNSLLGTTITQYNNEQSEADLALTQLRELLAEKEISVYNMRCESNELKDRLCAMENQVKNLELEGQLRLKKINELNDRLTEKTKQNKSMAAVVEEYERTIASLIADIEQDKKQRAEEKQQLIHERDEQTAHLTSMEVSFSDLHSKYEKSKQVILTCKANEDIYKKSIKDFEEQVTKMQANYEMLKQHATAKLNHANQELEKMNRVHEAEVVKLKAMIKRNQVLATSLQETLAQKTKANDELTAICDELINKVG